MFIYNIILCNIHYLASNDNLGLVNAAVRVFLTRRLWEWQSNWRLSVFWPVIILPLYFSSFWKLWKYFCGVLLLLFQQMGTRNDFRFWEPEIWKGSIYFSD